MNKHWNLPLIACALVFLLGSSGHAPAQSGNQPADPALMLHFDFDENFSNGRVVDVSGHGNDGLQFNPTNWITITNGVFGSTAARFITNTVQHDSSGHTYPSGQYIGVTNLNGIAFLTNATISLWAQFDVRGLSDQGFAIALLDAGYPAIYASGGVARAANSWSVRRDYSPNLCFVLFPADGSSQLVVYWPDDVVQSGGSYPNLSTTRIHLYTVTVDCPGNQVIAYYDGQPFMTNTIGVPFIRVYGCNAIDWLCVGSAKQDGTPWWGDDLWPNDGYFTGRLDDLRIYNRTLRPNEIQTLYQGSVYAQGLRLQRPVSGSANISWPTKTNVTYQLEYQNILSNAPWSSLGLPVSGTGQTNFTTDPAPDPRSRFYRARLLP